jgi:regulator of sigma E protease
MDLDSVFRILQVVLGISLVIFVHELGHFLAARLCGVRVEVFSLGMGPRVLSFVRGATRYQLALVPIGGYVRMAGEDPYGPRRQHAPDELLSKSVGARFFIYSGGVLMNLAFGLVVFPIIFSVGVPLPRPVIKDPLPGGPAWQAGLVGGTEVLEIGGREIFDFMHIRMAIALGDPAGSELLVREPSGATRSVFVVPRYDKAEGVYTIDVELDVKRGDQGGFVLDVAEGSPLALAGARTGDAFLGVVGGAPGVPPLTQLALAANGEPIALRVAGAAGERTLNVKPVDGPLQPPRVGIAPPFNRVAGLRGSARGQELAKDDRLISVGNVPILRRGDLERALLAGPAPGAAAIPFAAERGDERIEGSFPVSGEAEALALAADLALTEDLETQRIVVSPGDPAASAGLCDRDAVVDINGAPSDSWEDTSDLVKEAVARSEPAVFTLEREEHGSKRVLKVAVEPQALPVPDYGLVFAMPVEPYLASGPLDALRIGVLSSWRFAEDSVLTIRRALSRDVSAKNFGGIIGISRISYSFAEGGWTKLFFFLCLLSINLAVLNVLPIPLLDGGHLFFLIIEKLKGSPVSERILGYSQLVGLVLILSLLIMVTYNDLVRWVLPPG